MQLVLRLGYVLCTFLRTLDCYPLCASCESNANSKTKTYRGACTDQNWSNTTACPTELRNDGKNSPYRRYCRPSSIHILVNGNSCSFFLSILVLNNTWSILWQCPQTPGWWCGNGNFTSPCQTGISASFVSMTTGGSILGFPPVTPPPSAPTQDSSNTVTTILSAGSTLRATTVLPSSSANTSAHPPMPTQNQEHQTSLPTAIGVGIGVPLVIAIMGFLGFLFWKETVRQRTSKLRIPSQDIGLKNGNQVGAATMNSPWNELHDRQLPRELDGYGRSELHDRQIVEI